MALGARRPGVERYLAHACQVLGVGYLDSFAADQHAPAGTGRLVGAVDLERDVRTADRGVELGPFVGTRRAPCGRPRRS